jgi:hypothetical protein
MALAIIVVVPFAYVVPNLLRSDEDVEALNG